MFVLDKVCCCAYPEPALMRSRYKALLVWLAAVAFVSPQIGALIDNLQNEHSYCAAHDELVHGDAGESHELLALRAPGSDRGAKPHTHCETCKSGLRPAETYEKAPTRAPAKASQKQAIDEAPVELSQLPIYAYAPKTSPPTQA
jgi:hypothetical protein